METHETTGTHDIQYNLVSILYHTLQEAQTLQQYIDDARSCGEDDAAEFFADVQEQDKTRAEHAQSCFTATGATKNIRKYRRFTPVR